MRCPECAAEVAVTDRACTGCGAPTGQPPVVADGADTLTTGIGGAAVEAVPAGVVGQAPLEPYVPGSGDRLPGEFRLVLVGHVGLAVGLFAGGLAGAAAWVLFFLGDLYDPDDDMIGLLLALASMVGPLVLVGLLLSFGLLELFKAHSRFSTLLRRPSDQRMATVVASRRGGRTLILDIPWDGAHRAYQPLSEVRLALWMRAGMLVPGERVTVYGGPSGENALLISSAQRGRAFLGTMKERSTVQPGPISPLDERVSAATLVDWAAWAAATTFSYIGVGSSYDTREVEAFRSTVRDAFLGVREPPLTSDGVRSTRFSTRWLWEGYDKKQVDAFLEAAAVRLAAMESTDRLAGPLVMSSALLVAWAEWVDSATFSKPRAGHGRGCTPEEVDAFQEEIRDTFIGATRSPVTSGDVRSAQFFKPSSEDGRGYDDKQVKAFLDAAGIRLAAMESTDRPSGPLVSVAILARWAARADSTTFPIRRRTDGYDTAEVDAFLDVIRDTFHGIRPPPLTWPATHGNQFTTTRPGYDAGQVDAFLDKAEPRLAAMRATDQGAT
jgi:DivIVA domain-containing protein